MEKPLEYFNHNRFTLEYRVYNGGNEVLLAFHGFGKNANDMEMFEHVFSKRYTIYAFNFFHHGGSVYPQDRIHKNTLLPAEWNEMMEAFLKENNIQQFSLFGFSMGGKLSLEMLNHFTHRVKAIYLLAPDGLKNNFWYSLTSRNRLGNTIYRGIIKRPKFFFGVTTVLRYLGLLNKRLHRFVKSNLSSREKRQMVYNVWMTMRHIKPDLKKVSSVLKERNIHLYMLFGAHDKVIPMSVASKLTRYNQTHTHVYVVDCGHNLIVPESAQVLEKILEKKN